jgi:hypothetical protein
MPLPVTALIEITASGFSSLAMSQAFAALLVASLISVGTAGTPEVEPRQVILVMACYLPRNAVMALSSAEITPGLSPR